MNKQKDLYNSYKSTLLLNVFKNETNLMVLLNVMFIDLLYTLCSYPVPFTHLCGGQPQRITRQMEIFTHITPVTRPSHREVEGKCQKGQRVFFKPQQNLLPQP